MNAYQRLLCFLKVVYNNITTLHRNLGRDSSWLGLHEQLGDWYEMVAAIIDDLTETGIALGYQEPTISDALLLNQQMVLPTIRRGEDETLRLVAGYFRAAAQLMADTEPDVPANVASHLQDIQYRLNKEANYKIAHAIGVGAEEEDDD